MQFSKLVLALCILLLISWCDARKRKSRRSKRNRATCRARSMVRYQMSVRTLWDRDTFPKMYPTYRPPAHWSRLIGRSHGANYRMWREGTNASLAVKTFAEDENTEVFDLEHSQGHNDVLDAFVAPEIHQGVGDTSAVFFVDSGHSKVSFMMTFVPSPDWFIGLDTVDLCYRGRWKKKIHRKLQPFDAGTDQGLTFTAPKWPNDPQEPISLITSSFPDHQASAFFYPEYKVLPPLALVDIELVSEYRLRKTHKEIQDLKLNRSALVVTKREPAPKGEPGDEMGQNYKSKRIVNPSFLHAPVSVSSNSSGTATNKMPPGTPGTGTRTTDNRGQRHKPNKQKSSVLTYTGESFPVNIDQMTLEDYRRRVDCQVSEWAEWSACSQTCGFGTKHRSRQAIRLSKNGGAACPLLKDESLCGSMRTCTWKHFSLIRNGIRKAPNDRHPRRRKFRNFN